uniref:Hypothetical secreted protein 821 n=1 Tax=Amblyomma variegatum TaxID=34610 RepID=F0JA86_AMBVA|nr:TPA_inf: hypothetical secreted protein 821 [Amblyomma variegatum]
MAMARKAWGPQFHQTLFWCTMCLSAPLASPSQQPRTALHGLPLLSPLQLGMLTEKQEVLHMALQTNQLVHEHLLHPWTGPCSSSRQPLLHLRLQWPHQVVARVARHGCSPAWPR